MSKRRKHPNSKARPKRDKVMLPTAAALEGQYRQARPLAGNGDFESARVLYEPLVKAASEARLRALVANDLATLAVLRGDSATAHAGYHAALAIDDHCTVARSNLALLEEDEADDCQLSQPASVVAESPPASGDSAASLPRVAILSFLFNWPSTGGGIVHTVELAKFLGRAGYVVRHFYPRFAPWQIGGVQGELPFASEALSFEESGWTVAAIQERFRRAVDAFGPDYVLIQDCWNFKPHLAEAMRGYSTLLRFQALECLCPLNNVRLLPEGDGKFAQCARHQLATPQDCSGCLRDRGRFSGALHQAERALSGVGTVEYHETLLRALREAEAVLVLNPLTEAMLNPYARRVKVVPWGMDAGRFPEPSWPEPTVKKTVTIFQAGVIAEAMKGFHVLREACALLWQKRQDFELVATEEPAGRVDAMTRFTGWVSQEELPRYYREADIVVVPTIAQEGLSRTSVEAMAAGKPVVGSRIGGVPFTVADGATGLLCEPGDAGDLAEKLERLLDQPELRWRMGQAGWRRFEEEFTWEKVIERYYRPLLVKKKETSQRR